MSVGFDGIAALAMLIAMTDATLRPNLIAPILWVAGLVALALAGVPLARRVARTSRGVIADAPFAHPAALHTSLGLIVMAGLLALMSTGHVSFTSSPHSSAGSPLSALVFGRSAVYIGYSTWRAVTLIRLPPRNLIGCREAASMAASVTLMAGALAV